MKKVFMAFAIAVFVFTSFTIVQAQYQFTLSDLQTLCLKNSNDFEVFVLQKGYSYDSETSSDNLRMYGCDIANSTGGKNNVSWTKYPNEPTIAGFTTTDKQYYLNLKTEDLTTANGWRFVREENKKSGVTGKQQVWYHYSNGEYHVALFSFNVGDITFYANQYYKEQVKKK